MTRHDRLVVTESDIAGYRTLLVSGTPADCANLSIYNLYPSKPDLVLSGPNLGINSGLPYSVSSGTLGGALVASLSGVPAIAVSCELHSRVWQLLEAKDQEKLSREFGPDWERLGRISARLAERVQRAGVAVVGRIPTLNTPWSVEDETPIHIARVRPGLYGSVFGQNSDGTYSLIPHELLFDDSPEETLTDDTCLQNGFVSLSVIEPLLSSHGMTKAEAEKLASQL